MHNYYPYIFKCIFNSLLIGNLSTFILSHDIFFPDDTPPILNTPATLENLSTETSQLSSIPCLIIIFLIIILFFVAYIIIMLSAE